MSVDTSTMHGLDAHALLRAAHDGGYKFPVGFSGFTAWVNYEEAGLSASGLVTVRAPREISYEIDVPERAEGWLRQELGSMAGHRWPTTYEQGDGRYEMSIDDDADPLGPLLRMSNDPYSSSYRVRDGRINQVSRQMGPMRFTITIQEHTTVPDGRVLPLTFMVSYWNTESERLTRADAYTDCYVDVEGIQLPTLRRVVTADDSGFTVRQLTLSDHRLLAPAEHPIDTPSDAQRHGSRAG